MIIVDVQIKTSRYRYLWLKSVRGFDPSKHCARCLVGEYAREFPLRPRFEAGLHLHAEIPGDRAPFLYLCGVTPNWAENLHVAMIPDPGGRFVVDDDNSTVTVDGAAMLEIPEIPEDMPAAFSTCRNYRFGRHYMAGSSPGGQDVGGPAKPTPARQRHIEFPG